MDLSRFVVGFEWVVEHVRGGVILTREVARNLVPTQGLDHILNVVLKGASQQASWYVGVYEGNYTPVAGNTAASIAAAATESSAYDEATRPAWIGGAVAAGSVDNTAARAEFTFNATKTIYGGFLISNSTKAGTSGVLISAVRFATAKAVVDNDILRVAAGIAAASA